ncbi:MAG: ExeM/NucH family extracellular endonuclease [Aeromicrobium sp.]
MTHTIADVQGDAASTPLAGTTVTIEGVVTADLSTSTKSGYNGYYLQDPAGDPTDNRSDGIFIFSGSAAPAIAIGDRVRVTGTAGEYFGLTQVSATNVAAFELIEAGVGVPAPVTLPATVVGAAREAYEGMLVSPEAAYLSSSHQLYNFGSLWLNVGALAVKATETTDAGEAANAIGAANRANRLLLDDGYSIQVSNANHPGGQPYFTTDAVVRNGDAVTAPAGGMILSYGFDDWRLQPQVPLSDTSPAEYAAYEPTFTSLNARTAAPEAVGGDFSVGSFNVFNYFTTFGGDARGAANAAAFAVQQSKIVSAINTLDADVVALQEIENSVKLGEEPDEALANLVDALNAAAGAGTWDYVPTPDALLDAATTDFITNAIIYKPGVATPVGDSFADVDETVWDNAREPIAQTFDVDGKVLTVVANHFKSKSPPSGNTAPEPADLQGFFNADRVEQATAVLGFVDEISADAAKGPDVLLLGDFNAYHEEDPIQVLTGAGLVDLVPDTTDEYTYSFDGELGSLDHAIATPSLAAAVTGTDVWTINSPEWSDRGYAFGAAEAGTPYRSSDHDPVKVGISSAATPVAIDIVSINDFHGRIEAATPAAGAATLGGMVDAYEAANPNTLFVSAGDSIGASTFTSFIQQDQPTIDALNSIGLDVSAFGNHEFYKGQEDVNDRVIPESDFPYLGANIYSTATGEPAYQEYSLHEVGGVTVGFIGAITEDMPELVSPAGIEGLEFRDIVTEVDRVAAQLSDGDTANGEADVLVLLVHEGAATGDIASSTDDSAFGEIATGVSGDVDAIISAHTHQLYNHQVPIDGTDRTRPVIQSAQYGEQFGHLALSVDPETGDLLSITSEVKPLFGAYDPDPAVAQIVADAKAVAAELGSVKVGDLTADFRRAKQTAAGTENRGGESTLGNFVADVQLWATEANGSQVALMNPGGLRADMASGELTYAEAAAVQPFANTLVTVDLTGAQLKSVLEEQWQPAGASRPFLKLGVSESLQYSYDPTAAQGERIGVITIDGEPVDPAATYKVTVNSFLASGGDNFFTLAEGTNRADTGKVDLESMVEYFEANPTATPDYAQRSVGVSFSAPAGDGYAAGDEVTLTLSSLLFSNGEPNAGTAVVSAGGVELGSAAIDPAIVDTTDEVGRATVTVTIPETTPAGTLVLTVAVPETGTSIDVPIEVVSSLEPIEVVTSPAISGSGTVGAKLTVSAGTWSVESPSLAYQWNRNGEAIEGATGTSYRLTAADAGSAITVTVTATADGSSPAVVETAAKNVAKLATLTLASPDRQLLIGRSSLTLTVDVFAAVGSPSGTVAVFVDGKKVASGDVVDGEASVKVTDLKRGVHRITAKFEGTDQYSGSTSISRYVIVL